MGDVQEGVLHVLPGSKVGEILVYVGLNELEWFNQRGCGLGQGCPLSGWGIYARA